MLDNLDYHFYSNLRLYDRSKMLVEKLFAKKKDKAGACYLNHLTHVSQDLKTEEQKALGLMHDILEDTDMTEDELRKLGYKEKFIASIKLLTNTYDSYDEYIDSIIESDNKDVMMVKLKDLLDNMDLTRLKKINDNDIKRSKKYINAYLKIINKMEGEII